MRSCYVGLIVVVVLLLTTVFLMAFVRRGPGGGLRFRNSFPDIDLVVTWVDGHDPYVRDLKLQYQVLENKPHYQSVAPERQQSFDELQFLLRSVELYAPWIRKVHILVSHHQCPRWLDKDHPKIHLVNDTEIFPNPNDLPTFNSHALECNMHRIPGLAEYFIYSCDDMMFGNHTPPSAFFNNDGTVALFVSRATKRRKDPRQVAHSMHQTAWFNNYVTLDMAGYTNIPQRLPSHQMLMTSKSIAQRMDERFPDLVEETSATRFRHKTNIHPLGLQLYLGCHEGDVRPADNPPSMHYVGWGSTPARNRKKLERLGKMRPQLMCINNIRGGDVGSWYEFATTYFPEKSNFEK